MTSHSELVNRAVWWLQKQGCGVVFDDRFRAICDSGEQPDAIGWRSGISILIECKANRPDFLADRKKKFRKDPAQGMGDWRFFMAPPGLISPDELPTGWGLLEVTSKTVRKVHGCLKSNIGWSSQRPFDGNKRYETQLMYSALRRVTIRGHFNSIYEPLAALDDG